MTAILFRALDHDPSRRHEDVSVLLNDLSESLGLIAPLGRRHRPGAGLWRLAGRWRVAAGVVGAAAALAALWLIVPGAGLPGRGSSRDGASQSGPSERAAEPVSVLPRPASRHASGDASRGLEALEPDASTAAAAPQSPPAALPIPPASPAAPEPPRPQEERALLPPAPVPTPRETRHQPSAASRPRPAPGRPAVENPTRAAGRVEFTRLTERSTPPRPTPTSRLDNDHPTRVTAGAIPRASRAESPHPTTESPRAIPSPRDTPAREGGEDTGAIIDWLLRDRR